MLFSTTQGSRFGSSVLRDIENTAQLFGRARRSPCGQLRQQFRYRGRSIGESQNLAEIQYEYEHGTQNLVMGSMCCSESKLWAWLGNLQTQTINNTLSSQLIFNKTMHKLQHVLYNTARDKVEKITVHTLLQNEKFISILMK